MSLLDKRKLERYALSIPAYLKYNTVQGQESTQHITQDVSAGGAFFHSKQLLPVGTGVKVDLVLPNQVRVKMNGAVIRSNRHGIAVCFDKKYKIIPSRN